jgi:hypothetical protein
MNQHACSFANGQFLKGASYLDILLHVRLSSHLINTGYILGHHDA